MLPKLLHLPRWISHYALFWAGAALVVGGVPACGHDLITTKITWSREISRLVLDRCAGCHRTGGSAFALTNYEEARPWAKAIKEEVLSRRMPPWGAVKGFGDFAHDPSLSQEEISLIAQWVEGGAPAGDANLLPPARLPSPAKATPPANTYRMTVTRAVWVVPADTALVALAPGQSPDGTRVTAHYPNGVLVPLVWLYAVPKSRGALPTFVYRTPVPLPKGTEVRIETKELATLTLWLSRNGAKSTRPAP